MSRTAFKMPRWGYAIMIEAAILAIGGGVFAIARIRRKKRAASLSEKEETQEITE